MRNIINHWITQLLFNFLTGCSILTAGLIVTVYSTSDQINVPPILSAIVLLMSIVWFWVFIFRSTKCIHYLNSKIRERYTNSFLVTLITSEGEEEEYIVMPECPFTAKDGRRFVLKFFEDNEEIIPLNLESPKK